MWRPSFQLLTFQYQLSFKLMPHIEDWVLRCHRRWMGRSDRGSKSAARSSPGRVSAVPLKSLAIKGAELTLRYHLLGKHFLLHSDHGFLQGLHRMKDTNSRNTRCYLTFYPLIFWVIHRLGSANACAYFLSPDGLE